MKKYIEDTINYYNTHAEEYKKEWNDAFVKEVHFDIPDIFLSYLDDNPYILDLGCGSGRDSKYFLEKGFRVKAIDGSKEMCKIAEELLGMSVEQLNFLDINFIGEFDGIFAAGSLLHLNNNDLEIVMNKLYDALKVNGILFATFKYGNEERFKKMRYFNDMTEEKFKSICNKIPGFKIIKINKDDAYKDHKPFINFVIKKIN